MPLKPGKSKSVVAANVSTEMKGGKPQKQAVAISYGKAGMNKPKSTIKKGGKSK